MLSASDIAFYREQGYLVVPHVLDPTTLDTVRREMARILDGARAVTSHTDMYDGYFCGAIDPAAIRDEIARAVPRTGRAGSMSFHHVRLVHGSAQNISSLPRTLLLYEYAAADAWPLMGVSDFADFNARLVTGEPSIEPRVAPVPVRMPLPPARSQGSIYENQSDASRRYFPVTDEPAPAPRT
jgi:phytanoyl-CoA hydroxylase